LGFFIAESQKSAKPQRKQLFIAKTPAYRQIGKRFRQSANKEKNLLLLTKGKFTRIIPSILLQNLKKVSKGIT
jgi:uncharacterized membrane protein (UPF0127 family)